MHLSRVVIKGFRSIAFLDANIDKNTSCVIGENNTGKSNFIQALRLCLDVNLSSRHRTLISEDIHCNIDQDSPFQVLIGVEFSGFTGSDAELAMLHGTQIGPDRARLIYRFRPKRSARENIHAAIEMETALPRVELEDYSWELIGGGDPAVDLSAIEWKHDADDFGASGFSFSNLQSFLVSYLPALRDAESDLAQFRRSPLAKLIEISGINEVEQNTLIAAIKDANEKIEASPTIRTIAGTVDRSFENISGPAFKLGVDIGLSEPSFHSIVRSIQVLLSGPMMRKFPPQRNGLGLNNILYISILIEHFKKRSEGGKSAGEIILIEEPEAHLHPQLQSTLMESLRELPFQSIVTTHSTQITSKSPLSSFVMLTNQGQSSPFASTIAHNPSLTAPEINDLERYLDATKANLLFARRVMLVEGPAELFLIPPLVKSSTGVDLEREGISIVAIHGVHFAPFAHLFNAKGLPKKCAIVADKDLDPSDTSEPEHPLGETDEEHDIPEKPDLAALQNEFVRVFLGDTTFEREITIAGNLEILSKGASAVGAPRISAKLLAASKAPVIDYEPLKKSVLSTAKRFGKARFAQATAHHVDNNAKLPKYIEEAVKWLLEE